MAGKIKNICCTFDVDLTDYVSDKAANEMTDAFPIIKTLLEKNPQLKTTWFIRIDEQINRLFGDPLYIFKTFAAEIGWLRSNGHEIGWHHHAYTEQEGQWVAEKREQQVISQLSKYAGIANAQGLCVSRMGWGYHSNAVVDLLEKEGFLADSSAIPRPVYPWDNGLKNWEGAPLYPYYPSSLDYRVPGSQRKILQVPMSTVPLSFPTDTTPGIIRYINPAYQTEYFSKSISLLDSTDMVTIIHPYEIIGVSDGKSAISFSSEVFTNNLLMLCQNDTHSFLTISQLAALYR